MCGLPFYHAPHPYSTGHVSHQGHRVMTLKDFPEVIFAPTGLQMFALAPFHEALLEPLWVQPGGHLSEEPAPLKPGVSRDDIPLGKSRKIRNHSSLPWPNMAT